MKKINLLLLATLLAGTCMAATTTIFDPSDAAWSADGVNLTSGATTVGDVTWYGRGSAEIKANSLTFEDGVAWTKYLKFGGGSTFKQGSDLAGVLTYTPKEAGTIKVYAKGGGNSARKLYVSQSITTTNRDVSTALASVDGENKASGIAVASVEAGEVVYVWDTDNMLIYGITFEASAPVTEPWVEFSKEEVELAVTPFATSDEAKVTLKGGNLTAGTYTLTVPNVAGLTVAPTSVTVADNGTVNQEITLTYTSTIDVPEANAKVSVTINELPAELTITYSARTTAYTQTTVSDSTTWDWAKAGIAEILLDSTTTPSLVDTILLANVQGIYNGADFRSDALKVCGQYLVRDSKFFQGGYISFIAEKKGTVQVTFSNTGNRDADKGLGRVLYINDVATNDSTLTTKTLTVSAPVEVPAGQVTITSQMPSEPGISQYLRVYSITYVPQETGTALEQNSLFDPATKVIRNGQLLIIREGKTYTVQGVEVK